MGGNCYESIGKPLPKRTNVVLTRNPFFIVSNCYVTHSIEEALEIAKNNGEEEAFIIGGAQIYGQSMDLWDKLYLTEVDLEVEGDVILPEINFEDWELISEEKHQADEKNEYDYTCLLYTSDAADE